MRTNRWVFWLMLGALALLFVYLIRSILLPFVVGMLAAYFLDPAVDALQRKKMSRGGATLAITGIFFLVMLVLCIMIPPLILDQLSQLFHAIPGYLEQLKSAYGTQVSHWLGMLPQDELDNLRQAAESASTQIFGVLTNLISGIFASGMVIANLFALLLITPVVTFYLLRDWDEVVAHFDSLLPRAHAWVIREQLSAIDATLAGFLRGQMNVCLILAVFYAVGLSLAGLKFGLVIGALAGVLVIIPYVGALFSAIIGLGIAFFQFDTYTGVALVAGVFLLGQALESYLLTPKLVGEKVGLHPVWIIFGMMAGGALFGFVGVLIAVPVTAVIGVLIRFATARYLESGYYQGR